MSMKNPVTPAGIEPATFRFLAQHIVSSGWLFALLCYSVSLVNSTCPCLMASQFISTASSPNFLKCNNYIHVIKSDKHSGEELHRHRWF